MPGSYEACKSTMLIVSPEDGATHSTLGGIGACTMVHLTNHEVKSISLGHNGSPWPVETIEQKVGVWTFLCSS